MLVKETGKEVSELVSLAAVTKYREAGSLKRTLIAHSPRGQEAQDQCAGQFGFSREAASWLSEGHLPAVPWRGRALALCLFLPLIKPLIPS